MRGTFLACLLCVACSQSVEDHSMYEANTMSGTQVPITGKKKGWQQAGPLKTNDTTKFVTLQANFEDDPGNYTIQFGIVKPPDPTGTTGGAFACKADIYWSVEGQTVKRTVSVGNGVSVSGTGQGVKVRIYDTSNAIFGPGNYEYIVSAQIVKGTRPNVGKPPTIWMPIQTIAPGSAANFAIPKDAGVISLNVEIGVVLPGSYPVSANVVIQAPTGVSLCEYDPNVAGAVFVPIPPGASDVAIENRSAADSYRMQVNFGIDG